MAVIGVGVDIESISRFKNLPFDKNKKFYEKIFTQKEIDYCLKKADPYQHFAVRFCAKEAFIKAINQEIVDHKFIEVIFDKNKPSIKWDGVNVFVSLSHDKDKVVAFVLVEK